MAPASTRSSSISSASTTSSSSSSNSSSHPNSSSSSTPTPTATSTPKDADAPPTKKKFACSFPSCGKSFSRSEHLHRHALNHKDGNNTCQRCSAHFRRRDLLDRHMARHKEKDDEAGGEGLGFLATRKRLWRDADGSIVNARRPSSTQSQDSAKRRQLSRGSRKDSSSSSDPDHAPASQALLTRPIPISRAGSTTTSSTIVEGSGTAPPPRLDRPAAAETACKTSEVDEDSQPSWLRLPTLPSPPISEPQSAMQSPSPELSDLDTLYEDSWPVMHHGLPEIVNHSPIMGRQSEYPASPSWGPQPFQTFMGAMAELSYDDIFRPETGLYDWQAWNSQVLSRCREEKFEPFAEKREREWNLYPGQDQAPFKRTFGLGTC
ncbi:hypothetical protein LZ554_006119 [Drepanopeziza brunnea f. sp. 'monogermtubi']|nr:hypothetical protein LZ554_006119 [Drepanopeziza brunnea f. sp. 'monogermtubi']